MYSSFPQRDRIAIRSALSVSWGFTALSGVGGILLTPNTLQGELGDHFPLISALLLFVAAAGAMVGVITNRYQIEWVAAWFAAAGQLPYLVIIWVLVFTTTPTRLQQAAALTSLMFFYVYRITMCSAHARKQRKVHELVKKMTDTGETRLPHVGFNSADNPS